MTVPVPPAPLHAARSTTSGPPAWLGIALGVTFTICFTTGLWSHIQQNPPSWFDPIARPAGLYRVTQGLHVATGIASIPLLLAKLWVVYPKLFRRPVFSGLGSLLERLSLIPLIGGGIFLLFTGLANINLWYPWPFNFRTSHYWVAWITIGALIVHVGAKLTTTRTAISATGSRRPRASREHRGRPTPVPRLGGRCIRRAHRVHRGPDRLATAEAGAARTAPTRHGTAGLPGEPFARRPRGSSPPRQDPGYRLVVEGNVQHPLELSLDQLRALPLHRAVLPIACVEGWSASPEWRGVRVRDLLERAGAPSGARVRVHSLQQRFAYASSDLDPAQAHDVDTLLALEVGGEPLHLDHGYPLRLIGPNRPGVNQTKWVTRLVVS